MTNIDYFLNNADPISKDDIENAGIDISNVTICRRLRRLAENNSLVVDKNVHRDNPRNLHLFDYIKYCEYDVDTYVREYLKHIQPYMIKEFPSQEKQSGHLCILDENYRISLYIKADTEKRGPLIISFHENNKDGIAHDNKQIRNRNNYVPVIADNILSNTEGSNRYVIRCLIHRGTLALPINVTGYLAEGDIFIVSKQAIEQEFIDQCNDYIQGLYTSNLPVAENMEIFSVMQQIAFTSHGNSTFSNISKLLDNMDIQNTKENKAAAGCVLLTYINHLTLTKTDQAELIKLLEDKKQITPSRNYAPAIDACIDAIQGLPGPSAPDIPVVSEKPDINRGLTVESDLTEIGVHVSKDEQPDTNTPDNHTV